MDTNTVDLTKYREQYTYYSQKLLSDLGLGDVAQPERGELLLAIEKYVQQVLTNTLLENLDDTSLDQVETMLSSGSDEDEVAAYLVMNIPEIDVKMADALATAYARMLKECQAITDAVLQQPATPVTPPTSTPNFTPPTDMV